MLLGIALAFGLLLLPWLIWAGGQLVLGPYARGGATQFVADFYRGLGRGAGVVWVVALAPAFFMLLIRLLMNLRHDADSDAQRGQ